jgi:hypothetical protein
MNTESTIRDDDQPAQPLVQWFPSGGMAKSAPAAAAGLAALVLGALVYAGFSLARAAVTRRHGGELTLDRLVVRKLTVLED